MQFVMKQSTGRRIAALRKERQWTQEQLADFVGVARITVSSWETDTRTPHRKVMNDLARLFGTTAAQLYGEAA